MHNWYNWYRISTEQERKKSVQAQLAIHLTDALNKGTAALTLLRRRSRRWLISDRQLRSSGSRQCTNLRKLLEETVREQLSSRFKE
jgi:hypothetical protein